MTLASFRIYNYWTLMDVIYQQLAACPVTGLIDKLFLEKKKIINNIKITRIFHHM